MGILRTSYQGWPQIHDPYDLYLLSSCYYRLEPLSSSLRGLIYYTHKVLYKIKTTKKKKKKKPKAKQTNKKLIKIPEKSTTLRTP
jgi:hypothetical protein